MQTNLLKKPVITEKSMRLANRYNTYTFAVEPKANKNQIKKMVEKLYEVNVIKVNTVMRAAQTKRTGRRRLPKSEGRTKKALVTLAEKDTIELFDTYRE